MAHNLAGGLAGLSAPGKAAAPKAAPKNKSYMTIEPLKPAAPAAPKSEVIAPPKKPGMPSASISPLPKAGMGWKAQSAIGKPGDVQPASNLRKV